MQTPAQAQCTHCHASLSNPLVCSACRELQAPKEVNYFELFGLAPSYQIDAGKLTASFRAITRQIHPDRFGGASEDSRNQATHLTALVNEAYSALNDPVLRANYLLELAGGPSAIEVRDVPGTLLMEVMELREQIEEAKLSGDQSAFDSMRDRVMGQKQQALDEIASRAETLPTTDENQKREFRKLLNAMRYYENLLDELAVDPLAASGANTK